VLVGAQVSEAKFELAGSGSKVRIVSLKIPDCRSLVGTLLNFLPATNDLAWRPDRLRNRKTHRSGFSGRYVRILRNV